MKSLKYNAAWNIGIESSLMPQIVKSTEVVVDIAFTGICGTDIGIISDDYPVAVPSVTLGHESSGIVIDKGSAVSGLDIGDRVVVNPTAYCGHCRMCQTLRINHCENKFGTESGVSSDGTFAEYFVSDQAYLHKLPDHVSLQTATLTEPLSCVLTGLRKLTSDTIYTNVVVVGAGPIGLLYTWALSLKGHSPTVLENAPARVEYAKRAVPAGVDIISSLDQCDDALLSNGLDLVVDTTSGVLELFYPLLAAGGTFLSVGLKKKHQAIDTMMLADNSLNLVGSIDSKHGAFVESFNLICGNHIPVGDLISHTYPLDQYSDALKLLGCNLSERNVHLPSEPCCKVLLETC